MIQQTAETKPLAAHSLSRRYIWIGLAILLMALGPLVIVVKQYVIADSLHITIAEAGAAGLAPNPRLAADFNQRIMICTAYGILTAVIACTGVFMIGAGGLMAIIRNKQNEPRRPHWVIWSFIPGALILIIAFAVTAGGLVYKFLLPRMTTTEIQLLRDQQYEQIRSVEARVRYQAQADKEYAERKAEQERQNALTDAEIVPLLRALGSADSAMRLDAIRRLGPYIQMPGDPVRRVIAKSGLETLIPKAMDVLKQDAAGDDKLSGIVTNLGCLSDPAQWNVLSAWFREHRFDKLDMQSPEAMTRAANALTRWQFDELKALMDRGLPLNGITSDGKTLVSIAIVDKKHPEILNMLLDRNARVDGRLIRGDSPLHEAIRQDNTELVLRLINMGADVNAPTISGNNKFGRDKHPDYTTPLFTTHDRNNLELMALLLDHGADPNLLTMRDMTVLDYVVQSRQSRAAAMRKLLLAHGALSGREVLAKK